MSNADPFALAMADEYGDEWAEWLAEHDAEVRRRALADAYDAIDVAAFATNGPGDHPDSFTGLSEAGDIVRGLRDV